MWLLNSQSEASIRCHWPIRGLRRRLWISRVRCRRSKVGELLKQNMIWVDRSYINEVRIWHRSLSRYCDPWITPGMLFMGRLKWPLKNKDKNKIRDFRSILFSSSNFLTQLFSSNTPINPVPARLYSHPASTRECTLVQCLVTVHWIFSGPSQFWADSEQGRTQVIKVENDKINSEFRSWKLLYSPRHEKLCKAERSLMYFIKLKVTRI